MKEEVTEKNQDSRLAQRIKRRRRKEEEGEGGASPALSSACTSRHDVLRRASRVRHGDPTAAPGYTTAVAVAGASAA
jgi:hypothetical protein